MKAAMAMPIRISAFFIFVGPLTTV
jgi:hypothetical protein